MKSDEALRTFRAFLATNGSGVDLADPTSALRLSCSFYERVRAGDCDLQADGDMLLFQWGVYDWGSGPRFEFNVTRQFIPGLPSVNPPMEADFDILHLSWSLFFQPTPALEALGKKSHWCNRPSVVPDLLRVAEPVAAVASEAKRAGAELTYGSVE